MYLWLLARIWKRGKFESCGTQEAESCAGIRSIVHNQLLFVKWLFIVPFDGNIQGNETERPDWWTSLEWEGRAKPNAIVNSTIR
jgi:hypothetical protein